MAPPMAAAAARGGAACSFRSSVSRLTRQNLLPQRGNHSKYIAKILDRKVPGPRISYAVFASNTGREASRGRGGRQQMQPPPGRGRTRGSEPQRLSKVKPGWSSLLSAPASSAMRLNDIDVIQVRSLLAPFFASSRLPVPCPRRPKLTSASPI